MKIAKIVMGSLAVMVVLLMAGKAFAQDVKVDFDDKYDFSKLKTFSIKIATTWGNPLSEGRALEAFEGALVKKGWTKADEATADALVLLHGATQQKHDVNTFYTGYGGYGYYGWGGGMSTAHTSVSEYTVGMLVVDIFDAKSKQLIFRGTATDEISDKPEKNQKKINKATEKMFKKFPPEPKKK